MDNEGVELLRPYGATRSMAGLAVLLYHLLRHRAARTLRSLSIQVLNVARIVRLLPLVILLLTDVEGCAVDLRTAVLIAQLPSLRILDAGMCSFEQRALAEVAAGALEVIALLHVSGPTCLQSMLL